MKNWYLSKTLWANLLAIGLLWINRDATLVDDKDAAILLAAINIILRVVTRDRLRWATPAVGAPVVAVLLSLLAAAPAGASGSAWWEKLTNRPPVVVTNAPPVVTNTPPPVVTNVPPPAVTAAVSRVHATNFLRQNASWSPHVFFSPKLTDAQREEIIRTLAADGYTRIYLYTANSGDYGGKSVRYTHDQRATWLSWLRRMRAAGLAPVLWIRADDSGDLDKWSETQWMSQIDLVVGDLNPEAEEYTIGLEVNEYWAKAFNSSVSTTRLVQHLQRASGKKVGVHTTGISAIAYATAADVFYLQYGFGKSASEIVARTKEARSKLRPGQILIAGEYAKSGETDEARRLGDAAVIDGGADGVGNGCTARAIQALLQRTGGMTNGPPPPPPPGVTNGLTFSKGSASRYVQWDPSIYRDGWPMEIVKGKHCDALLYGAKVGGTPRKIEWVKAGADETGLRNAYDDVNDPKYDQGWRPGDRVILELRDTKGVLRDARYRGEWVLQ